MRGEGRGGPNAEFALGAALALRGRSDVWGLAADTDGIDGVEANAGTLFDGATPARMGDARIDPHAALRDNDAFSAFEAVGQLLATGPAGTSVNDFRVFLIKTKSQLRKLGARQVNPDSLPAPSVALHAHPAC